MTDLLEDRVGKVAILTLNRPDAMNALSDTIIRGLLEAFERLGRDEEVGAIVLTGAGRGFCAGGDVKGMANRGERSFEERVEDLRWKQRLPLLIRTSPKVVVAAVNGAAMGAGFSLALACDFRVVARSAKMGTAFAAVGYSGDFGITWWLTTLVGPAKARELLMLNPRLSAEDADGLGLVTVMAEDGDVVDEAVRLATQVAEGPRLTWSYMKRNLLETESAALARVLDMEAMSQSRCAMTEDHREARSAWAEKRPPQFKGR